MTPDPAGSMPSFPFSAVVGHDEAKLALMLAAIEPRLGGILLRGQKGSAKTTLARGLAALLAPGAPFVELPVGATEDRVVGSLDLARALTGGEVRFAPGLLAAADGGVLYVDEVNLLADHLVDVLLDVAASGVNRVEREGVSHTHRSRFVLIGSMNPEEGELRPQLLDRFGLAVDVAASADAGERAEAVRRRLAFDADPAGFCARWAEAEAQTAARLAAATRAELPDGLLRTVCTLCSSAGAEGLRADLVIARASVALAGLAGRPEADVEDVRRVAPLALAHRRRHPLEDAGVGSEELDSALESARNQDLEAEADGDAGKSQARDEGERGGGPAPERWAEPDAAGPVARLQVPRTDGGADGRRSVATGGRGRLVSDRHPGDRGLAGGVAVAATVRAAAGRAAAGRVSEGKSVPEGQSVPIVPGDLREAVREQRVANLVILAVDASGSMGSKRRMEAAKGALMGLLLDAYQRRDRVALVSFRDEGAEVILRPTGSVEVARARLADLVTGGRTPLAAGIDAASKLATEAERSGSYRPLVVFVTDGRATAAAGGADPLVAARRAAGALAKRRVATVVVDAEDGPARLGLAAELADALAARCLSLDQLTASTLRSLVANRS